MDRFTKQSIVSVCSKRVFLLGPSHHVHIDGCALTVTSQYATPLGNIAIDLKTTAELKSTRKFQDMSLQTDEDEHSLEMHLPYIAKIMAPRNGDYTLVPVLVGTISRTKEKEYGELFRPYLEDPSNLFVISSDFCHWGTPHHAFKQQGIQSCSKSASRH